MGYFRHHAIIVTSWLSDANSRNDPGEGVSIERAHNIAHGIFGADLVSPIVDSKINGYRTFFIAPDGSKEGWDESNTGDGNRRCFIAWLDQVRYSDGSSSLTWAEIQYGDESGDNRMLHHDGIIGGMSG